MNDETFRKAKAAARKALDLDSELGEAHGSLAHVRLHDWDWEGLEKDFQKAIQLNPAEPIVYYWYGEFLMSMGRPEEAIVTTQRAHLADPLSPVISSSLAMIFYLARKYDQGCTPWSAPSRSIPITSCRICEWAWCRYNKADMTTQSAN